MLQVRSDGSFRSINPATGETVWEGSESADIDAVVDASRRAGIHWASTLLDNRVRLLHEFAARLRADRAGLAQVISSEVGKPHWEALTEVDAMINKIPASIQAYSERRTASGIGSGRCSVGNALQAAWRGCRTRAV